MYSSCSPRGMVLNGEYCEICHWCRQFYFYCLRKNKIWLKRIKKKSQTTKGLKGLVVSFVSETGCWVFDWCNGDDLVKKKRKKKWQKNNGATELRAEDARSPEFTVWGKCEHLREMPQTQTGSCPSHTLWVTHARSIRLRPQRRCHAVLWKGKWPGRFSKASFSSLSHIRHFHW